MQNHESPRARPTILICDDEPIVLKVLDRFLTRENFQVLATDNIQTALELLDVWKVSAVVVDLKLRGSDGLALVRAIHAWHRGVSCIVLTGYGCEAARALDVPCVQKGSPGSYRELVSKLRACLGYGPHG